MDLFDSCHSFETIIRMGLLGKNHTTRLPHAQVCFQCFIREIAFNLKRTLSFLADMKYDDGGNVTDDDDDYVYQRPSAKVSNNCSRWNHTKSSGNCLHLFKHFIL